MNCIQHQFTIPYHPQQNGVVEHKNRRTMESARSMLKVAGLPYTYWKEAVSTTCYAQNCLFTTTLNKVAPYEAWTGTKPIVTHMRIFGSYTYAYVPAEKRHKLDDRAEQLIFVGYGDRFGVKHHTIGHKTN